MENKGKTYWFYGLSGAGKSTIAKEVKNIFPSYVVLDGDVIREGICNDLGFSEEDRTENIRRVAEIAKLFNKENKNVIVACITPKTSMRKLVKNILPEAKLVYISTPLEECENRDVKGLYKKARNGEIKSFTGISDTFEVAEDFDFQINTENIELTDSVNKFINYIL